MIPPTVDYSLLFWTMVVGAVTNSACAMVGCYLVLRRLSLLGDAISHAILPGLVIAYMLTGSLSGLPIIVGAMVVGVLTAFFTQSLHSLGNVPEDASMGVVYTALFAVGVILIRLGAAGVDLDPGCVLYGAIDTVAVDTIPIPFLSEFLSSRWSGFDGEIPRVLPMLALVLAATLGFVIGWWKELKIAAFDPALATAMGLRAAVTHYVLMAMVAAVTVASFEAVGSILVIAMLVVPAATGHLLSDRLGWMMVWAVATGVGAAVFGSLAAFHLNTSVAGMMAVVAGAEFTLAVFFAPRHGLLGKAWQSLHLTLRIANEDLLARLYRAEEKGQSPGNSFLSLGKQSIMARCTIPWLLLRGQIRRSPLGLQLTEVGRVRAEQLVRAHRLWESYLDQHFHLPLDHLHEPAERIEHFLGPELQNQLSQELAGRRHDPHGRAIPETTPPSDNALS